MRKASPGMLGGIVSALVVAAIIAAAPRVPGAVAWSVEAAIAASIHLRGTLSLPIWGVYLLVLTSTHTLIYVAVRVIKPCFPSVTAYSQDCFGQVRWRWSFTGKHPFNPVPFCPRCDTQLVYEVIGTSYDPDQRTVLHCEHCCTDLHTEPGDVGYLRSKVIRQIERNIRAGVTTNASTGGN